MYKYSYFFDNLLDNTVDVLELSVANGTWQKLLLSGCLLISFFANVDLVCACSTLNYNEFIIFIDEIILINLNIIVKKAIFKIN